MPPVPKPEKRSASERRRLAVERRALHYGGADDWPALKEQVFKRDRWACLLCKRTAFDGWSLQCAHVRSVGMGGVRQGSASAAQVADPSNLATLCVDCHRAVDQGTERAALRERLSVQLDALYNRLERS